MHVCCPLRKGMYAKVTACHHDAQVAKNTKVQACSLPHNTKQVQKSLHLQMHYLLCSGSSTGSTGEKSQIMQRLQSHHGSCLSLTIVSLNTAGWSSTQHFHKTPVTHTGQHGCCSRIPAAPCQATAKPDTHRSSLFGPCI
mgnify:CR=1 FL=1